MAEIKPSRDIDALLAIMAHLRTPGIGCPWDIEQTFETIAPYTIEEACEVADAIERNDRDDLREELGDLLLQVVFHARMAQEQGLFDFGDVVGAITAKLIRRHPHVFGQARNLPADAVGAIWSAIKAQEKAERHARRVTAGLPEEPAPTTLSGVPASLPALARAVKLQTRAAAVGFDWSDPRQVLAKIREECDELERELDEGRPDRLADEVGDLLFAVANIARHAKVDADAALRGANAKFTRRFAFIEQQLAAAGRTPAQATLDEMDALWNEAKRREQAPDATTESKKTD